MSTGVAKADYAGLPPQGEDLRPVDLPRAASAPAGDHTAREQGSGLELGRVKRVLNAGSGSAKGAMHPAFDPSGWKEVRIDIDARNAPDVVGSIAYMRDVVEDGSFDAIWCSHCIEHLHDHEVLPALREFRRILTNTGFAIVSCPNLDAIARTPRFGGHQVGRLSFPGRSDPASGHDLRP